MTWIWTHDGTANDSVNLSPTGGSQAALYIQKVLTQAGWVTKMSGDGLSAYSATANILTSSGTGANGIANTLAWFRMQDPAGLHEFVFVKGSGATTAKIKFSHSAKFTGGSPSATAAPSATDEFVYLGGGTDAAPTYGVLWATDGTWKLHIGADNAAPYDWWFLTRLNTTGAASTFGGLFNCVAGSYPSADAAPYVFGFGNNTTGSVLSTVTSALVGGWYKFGLSGATWAQQFFVFPGAGGGTAFMAPNVGAAANYPLSAYTGNDQGFPIGVGRQGTLTQAGHKGWLSTGTILAVVPSRNAGDFEDVGGTSRYVVFDNVGLRWPTGVLPIL